MAKDLAIVLNDGGLSGAVVTALAAQKYRPVMIYCDTEGQNPPPRRKAAYDRQVAHFKPFREHTIDLTYLNLITPAGAKAATIDRRGTAGAAVTGRLRAQMPLLAAAAGFAGVNEAKGIYTGLCVGEAGRPGESADGDDLARATEYLQIWTEMFQITLGMAELAVTAPLLELELWQVIDLGFQIGAPLDRTWSCAEDAVEPCGTCRGCRARDAAFMRAAKVDPARAAAPPAGR